MGLRKTIGLMVAALLAWPGNGSVALGGFQEFTDPLEWQAAVGSFTTIDFTGFPDGTFITDQYADLGVVFTDGTDTIFFTPSFINDSWGLAGNGDIHLSFTTPQAWIGVDFPGFLSIELFSAGKLIHTAEFGSAGVGNFGGLIASKLFDAAVLSDRLDDAVFIDDLHFGVPAPGALWLLAVAALFPRRRRR